MAEQIEGTQDKYVTLTLDKEYYALNIASVREILELNEITHIPKSPKHVRGVVNVRGQAVPVMDLRVIFGLPEAQTNLYTRVVIMELEREGEHLAVGLIADTVKEVAEIEASLIEAPPKMANTDLVQGVARVEGRFVLILDVDKLFAEEDSEVLATPRAEELLDESAEQGLSPEEVAELLAAPIPA
jgi:purine-binding chemotaxis protein CheW